MSPTGLCAAITAARMSRNEMIEVMRRIMAAEGETDGPSTRPARVASYARRSSKRVMMTWSPALESTATGLAVVPRPAS